MDGPELLGFCWSPSQSPELRTLLEPLLPGGSKTGAFSTSPSYPRTTPSVSWHTAGVVWARYFQERSRIVLATMDFLAEGVSRGQLGRACESGSLIRVRRGHYALPDTDSRVVESVRAGGRLACASAAGDYGLFSFDQGPLHICMKGASSHPRYFRARANQSSALRQKALEIHWGELMEPSEGNEYWVGLLDAIRQTFLCQHHRLAMATLENALHLHRIPEGAVPLIFSRLPARLQYLRWQVDERSESGQETVLRLILREAGFHVAIQVSVEGVGRVDMVVEGVIVVEADSRQFHDGWESHARDRKRDVTLAGLGYMSLRVLYQDIMFDPQRIVLAVQGLLHCQGGRRLGSVDDK